jgi:hypothetical protein
VHLGEKLQSKPIFKQQWPRVKSAAVLFMFVQVAQFMRHIERRISRIVWSASQIELTSQVCATRANIMEWRSCLQFAGQWHKVSLQAAYKLWQAGGMQSPACPANQWGVLKTGQPMVSCDQNQADSELPPDGRMQVLKVDAALSAVHEKYLLITEAKSATNYSDQFIEQIREWEKEFQLWVQLSQETDNFNFLKYPQSMKAVNEFAQKIKWDRKLFH